MHRRHFLASIPPALALLSGRLRASDAPTDGIVVPGGSTEFALNIYGELAKQPGNVFCSPLSISVALALTARGAAGPTLAEMAKVLHLPLTDDKAHAAFGAMFLRNCPPAGAKAGPELQIANAIWVRKDIRFTPEFTTTAENDYRAKIKSVDFAQKDALCKEINDWVAQQTHDRIKQVVKPEQIDGMTVAELVNAIYFKGAWQTQFDKADTKDGDFNITSEKSVKAPFMQLMKTEFDFANRPDCSLLQMPYRDSKLAMLFILPPPTESLEDLEKKLTAAKLKEWVGAMKPYKPIVRIPKFDIDYGAQLAPVLAGLGMPLAFNERQADFSRMTKDTELYISSVTHKAVVTVAEEGTEAAAATAVEMREKSRPIAFFADRPFLFLIRDTQTGGILFMGRLTNPVP
jgi:serpin B